ncbi:MAG: tRNA (adenosine(37)-N6)-dimethylallyltransferase MiaA [Clostridia bacterium]|nr:tRNA (adenosine(37)-N6)-dimethylallyltransferase MiaA [Clostridia bacterium]
MKKAIVLGGQTGSGKTSLAIRLCREFGGEIISADSMQVYRKMDIGTAKPTAEELAAAPHHLIDALDITERFSSADFVALASKALEDITSRGKLPFVTGGTGLYSQMLFNSFSLSQSGGDPEVRRALAEEAAERGADALYAELCRIDPDSASRTQPNNVRRVIRYLEIFRVTGMTPTQMNAINNSGKKEYDPLYICLWSADRKLIYSRIDARVDKMFASGLEREARSLYDAGLENAPTAGAAIGYKELFPYFRGEYGLEEAKELIKRRSRNYAKRQQTYFKRIPGCVFVDIAGDPYASVKELVYAHLER